ncbi:MAG: PKD domain-containing protein [Flavobacteriales bacterium]|nr:PKD domain-containing protein [Flavobacteriales bacterium]
MALNSTGYVNVVVGYDVEMISVTTGRAIGVVCQYRVGTSGSWTTITPTSGSNPFSQTGGTVGVKTTVSATLPSACDNQAVVQVRWAIWRGVGSGSSSGLAIDNVTTNGTVSGSNTSVQFATTGSTVSEDVGTVDLTLEITDEDPTVDTDVDVVIIVGAPGRVNSYTTQTVNFPGGSGADKTLTITVTDNSLCDGDATITFQLQNITGGQGTAVVGTNDEYDLEITDNDLCTSVEFVSATSSGTEGGGTVALTLAITNPSSSVATTVDVALTSGSAADVNSYTTQTVTFPATSSDIETVTITITDDLLCEGPESLTFTLQNIGGGQGIPFIGSQATNVLTVTDNDAFAATVQDDFEDGNFNGWVENAAGRWSASSVNPINGAYSLREVDQNVVGSSYISKAMGGVDLSTSAASWQWQNGYNLDPSTNNAFWFWIAANEANVSSGTVDGYAVGVNLLGSTDLVTLWRVDNGISGTHTAIVTSAYNWDTGETGFRVTRSASGDWELFLDTNGDFDAMVSAGTGTDATYTTMDFVALYTKYSVSGGGILKFDDFAFSNVSCGNTYYSQSTGAVNDAIWSTAMVGSPIVVNFTIGDNMVVQNTHVVTVNNDTYVRNLDVQTGSGLLLNTGITLSAFGTAADLDGTITAAYGSTLALLSTSATALGTSGTPVLSNLTVSTAAGTTLTGNVDFTGTLDIVDGTFDATGGTVRLLSDATNTGNLGQVGATANYSGDMTVQRYIPAGATRWRLLGSPVDGADIADWDADFITAGFTGSDYPNFDNPVGSNILWPSIRDYDETNTGLADAGLEGVMSTAVLLDAGKGFAAWCGDNLTTTAAFTVDVTGPPNIASGPIDLEVTFTTGSGATEDGWNLVSNPLPSAIDFTEVTLGANTFNGYYVYDPFDGSTETWDEGTQSSSGTNLNGDIASSQGFWLKATAASPTNSSVAETAKVAGNGGPLFGGLQVPAFPIVRLNISSSMNSFNDNAVVVFDLGVPEFEPIDAPKIFFSDPSAPMIATLASTGESMVFNKYGAITEGLSIPVKVQSYVAGTYTITAGISGNPFSCMWLEDLQTGTITALTDGVQYSFQLAAGASTTPRFMIHSTAAVPMTLEPGLCGANGSATVDLGNNTADITWTTPTGTVILEQLGATGENTFSTGNAGNYTVHISTNAVCGEIVQDLYIDIDATEVVAAFDAPATAIVNEAIDFTNNSTVYGDFFWNFGDNTTSTETNPVHTYTEPGTYTVSLEVTADDCAVITTQDVVVQVSTGVATIAAAGLNVWSNAQGIVMEHSFTEGTVKVEVLDATGRLHIQRQIAAAPGRTVIATDALNSGIWFVRVTNGDLVQSFRVPLVR